MVIRDVHGEQQGANHWAGLRQLLSQQLEGFWGKVRAVERDRAVLFIRRSPLVNPPVSARFKFVSFLRVNSVFVVAGDFAG